MLTHDLIMSVLNKTGLTFTDNGTYFSSLWKIHPMLEIKVIIAHDIHPDWVHVLCNVGSINEYDKSIDRVLLRLNNKLPGTKFSLDQSQIIVCSSEALQVSEDELKKRITQVVKMVSLFYEFVEKENLKLNSR